MADIFFSEDGRRLLHNKKIIFIGDSNMRAIYKDFLWLLTHNTLIPIMSLRKKCERSYLGDTLMKNSKLDQGRGFFEVRQYKRNDLHVEFIFVTRCYNNQHIEKLLNECETDPESAPDVIVMNSCLWDICRWGPNGVPEYRENLIKLMQHLNTSLPVRTRFIWTTTLPLSQKCRGGFLIKQVEFLKHTCRFDLMEANMCAHQVVVSHGYDVLDFHYYFRMQTHRRSDDGIHWSPEPIRLMTNLLLTHISLAWDTALPGRGKGVALENMKSNQTRVEPFPPSLKFQQREVRAAANPLLELKNLQQTVEQGSSQDMAHKLGRGTSNQQLVQGPAVPASSQVAKVAPKPTRQQSRVQPSKKNKPQQQQQQQQQPTSQKKKNNQGPRTPTTQHNHHDHYNTVQVWQDPRYGGPSNYNENPYGRYDFNSVFMLARRQEEHFYRMQNGYNGRYRPYPPY